MEKFCLVDKLQESGESQVVTIEASLEINVINTCIRRKSQGGSTILSETLFPIQRLHRVRRVRAPHHAEIRILYSLTFGGIGISIDVARGCPRSGRR